MNEHKVNIKPPINGMMQKSHPKSYFVRCHLESEYFKEEVEENPRVLQIMLNGGEGYVLVEILPEDVYKEWCEENEQE